MGDVTDRVDGRGGHAKAVRVADLGRDGELEMVVSTEGAQPPLDGVFVLKQAGGTWQPRPLAGPRGVKYDPIELLDLDGDGDLDVITCEETEGLGLVWYGNAARSRLGRRAGAGPAAAAPRPNRAGGS